MNRKTIGLMTSFILFTLAVPVVGWAQEKPKPAAADRTLNVKLNYTGAGTVDEKHKIFVLVFDADPWQAQVLAEGSSRPSKPGAPTPGQQSRTAYILGRQGASAKDQTLTFTGLPVSPVYVMAFYDKTGTYDGHVDPALGSPKGAYGKPDKPDPIKLEEGKPAKIVVTFDDTSTIGG